MTTFRVSIPVSGVAFVSVEIEDGDVWGEVAIIEKVKRMALAQLNLGDMQPGYLVNTFLITVEQEE
jgi:hypothetical protein